MKRFILIFLVSAISPLYSMVEIIRPVELGVKKVVIDPGHGGHDPGNLGTERYKKYEKHVALDVGLKLGALIEKNFPDVEVIYTRDTDKSLELWQRTALANSKGADLFISIHTDSFTKNAAYGSTTYVMGNDYSERNFNAAKRENSVILLEDNYEKIYKGFDPSKPETYIALKLMQNAYMEQSISFAEITQKYIKTSASRKSRGVKQGPFWVIVQTTMPSVLVELGFTTNNAEEDYLHSDKGKTEMADALFKAFKEYKIQKEAIDVNADFKPDTNKPKPIIEKQVEIKKPEPKTVQPVEKSKPLEKKDVVNTGVVFKVQIATSAHKKSLTPANFKGVDDIGMYEEGGVYKYTYGSTQSYNEATNMQNSMRRKGFNGAFVIAFNNGQKITVKEALQLLK